MAHVSKSMISKIGNSLVSYRSRGFTPSVLSAPLARLKLKNITKMDRDLGNKLGRR
ncbi:hypothetical protein D3C73_1393490 [compost metagenome]